MGERRTYDKRDQSRPARHKIGKMIAKDMKFEQAEDEIFTTASQRSNRKRTVLNWIKRDLWPYGKLDPCPDITVCQAVAQIPVPTIRKEGDYEEIVYYEGVVQQDYSVVIPEAQKNDSVVIPEEIYRRIDALEADIATIKGQLQSSQPDLQVCPKLIKGDEMPTSFRLPKKLVYLAKKKAKQDTRGRMGLSALVEAFLFDYVGRPDELIEKDS